MRRHTFVTIDGVAGWLRTSVIDPFVAHILANECYVCVWSNCNGEEVLFCCKGGLGRQRQGRAPLYERRRHAQRGRRAHTRAAGRGAGGPRGAG